MGSLLQPSSEPKPAFTQLLDRGLAVDVATACWCPTMDLLALVLRDGQLQVHRLNWQRLWQVTPEAPVTALAWRPDGKQLAVGQYDGAVLLINVEDGETLKRRHAFSEPVKTLIWALSDDDIDFCTTGGLEDRVRRLFEPPLPPPKSAAAAKHSVTAPVGYEERLGRRDELSWSQPATRLSVLACCTATGKLELCTSDLYCLINTDVGRMLQQACEPATEGIKVLDLALPTSLQELSVCWEDGRGSSTTTSRSSSRGEGMPGTLYVTTLDLTCVGYHAGPLCALGYAAAGISAQADACVQAAAAVIAEWDAAMQTHKDMNATLNSLLTDHGIDSDACTDLLLLATMGEYSAAMEHFLTSTAGEAGLKKYARAVDTALCAAHAVLVDRLQPELEMLAFRLGELRGMALAPQWREVLHLRPSHVGSAERAALQLLRLVEFIRLCLVDIAADYRIFFCWLMTALRRFPQDTVDTLMGYPLTHIDALQRFLHGHYRCSPLDSVLDSTRAAAPWVTAAVAASAAQRSEQAAGPDNARKGEGFRHSVEQSEAANVTSNAGATASAMPPPTGFAAQQEAQQGDYDAAEDEARERQADLDYLFAALQQIDALVGEHSDEDALHEVNPLVGRAAAQIASFANQSLKQDVQELLRLCTQALARPATLISTKAALARTVKLGQPQQDACRVVEYCGAELAVVTACEAGGVSCAACIRVPPLRRGEAASDGAGRGLRVALAAAPSGAVIVDAALYKNGALVTLLRSPEGCMLSLLGPDALHYLALPSPPPAATSAGPAPLALAAGAGFAGSSLLAQGARQRRLSHAEVHRPLAVSASRGVGFVLAGLQRALLFDLEEDEPEEEEEEDGGDADMAVDREERTP